MKFGYAVNSLRENVTGIGPDDLSRHVYVLGSTGSGKSTLIRNLYKHLEIANQTDTLINSSIYIDIKDVDAKLFLRQCENTSFDNDLVTYLDINKTNFGINLLELPRYHQSDREIIVSRVVGHTIEMFKEFYAQPQTFVQLERILRLLLLYLYSNTDSPTILDLYEIIVRLQRDGKTELEQILHHYQNITGPEMKIALTSISSLSKDAWISLLNRLEPFATDNYLKKKFSIKHTTIDFERMLMPGNITIFRISETETPKHVHGMAIMAIILKIWFAVLDRAGRIDQEKRTLVVLALDEFQRIKDLSVLNSILSQARTYNLGLILSHQNLAQIDSELLETIVGNTGTQFYGRVSGIDASKIARIVDPHFSSELTDQLTAQPDFIFTAKTRPPQGQEQSLPIQFSAFQPPPLVMNETETETFLEKMKDRYGVDEIIQSELQYEDSKKYEWTKQLYAEFRTKEEWRIVLFLHNNIANLTQIVEGVKSNNRKKTSKIIQKLCTDGVVIIVRARKSGFLIEREYALSVESQDLYFPQTFDLIGTADDINEVTTKAFQYYIDKQQFVSLVSQKIRPDETRCDLIAYDYENDMAIAVEIESTSQIRSNPEQVRFNMTKWKSFGFAECHVWSKSRKIYEIKEKLGKEADGTTIFLVQN